MVTHTPKGITAGELIAQLQKIPPTTTVTFYDIYTPPGSPKEGYWRNFIGVEVSDDGYDIDVIIEPRNHAFERGGMIPRDLRGITQESSMATR